eukprot:357641-Chlamydomonas_euryale.AAC.2
MSRPDRSVKLTARKTNSETVVKTSLRGLLVAEKHVNDSIVEAIEKRVVQCSMRTQNATVALNLLVRKLFHDIEDVKKVIVPEFWDTTFIRQLFLGTAGAQKPVAEVKDLFEHHPDLAPITERSLGDSNIYSFAAIKLATNIRNHLVLNLPKVVKRYLYDASGLNTDEAVIAQYKIYGWDLATKKKQVELSKDGEAKVEKVVKEVRDILGLESSEKVGTLWFKSKSNLGAITRLFIFVSRALERTEEKLFNILPICNFKAHFITIDSLAIVGILKEANFDGDWNSFLEVKKVAGKNCTFTRTIDTDGLVVNVHFTRPKNVIEQAASIKNNKPSLEGKRVLACDPGRSNILYIVEKLKTGEFKYHILSRRQYYAESGISKANRNSQRWNNLRLKGEIESLSLASPKSVKLDTFMVYVNTVTAIKTAMWKEYLHKRWREQTFRLYGGKKRTFAKFINRLNPTKETVLAYGASKFAPGGKGELAVPVSRAFKECCTRIQTFTVCEFRTTAVHWKDDSILQTVMKKERDADGRPVPVRGLLWCQSTNEYESKFVNRDRNAAINILRCAALPTRPAALDRAKVTGRLVKVVGKYI